MHIQYRDSVWGMGRDTGWDPVLPATALAGLEVRGAWVRQGDAVRCEAGSEGAQLGFGGADWLDYEVRCRVTAEAGGNVQVLFRLSPDRRKGYMLDLLFGWQAVAISRVGFGSSGEPVEKLSVVNHELRRGRGYDIEIGARGHSLTSYVDGVLVNQVTAFDCRSGGCALNVWSGRTLFERPMMRRLA